MYADIIVDISHEQLDKSFQYAVPKELENDIEVGMLVNVPFGRGNRNLTGYVIAGRNNTLNMQGSLWKISMTWLIIIHFCSAVMAG